MCTHEGEGEREIEREREREGKGRGRGERENVVQNTVVLHMYIYTHNQSIWQNILSVCNG